MRARGRRCCSVVSGASGTPSERIRTSMQDSRTVKLASSRLPAAMQPLPIDPLLPEIVASLRAHPTLVLEAPPGAGKTTRVPRALLDAGLARARRDRGARAATAGRAHGGAAGGRRAGREARRHGRLPGAVRGRVERADARPLRDRGGPRAPARRVAGARRRGRGRARRVPRAAPAGRRRARARRAPAPDAPARPARRRDERDARDGPLAAYLGAPVLRCGGPSLRRGDRAPPAARRSAARLAGRLRRAAARRGGPRRRRPRVLARGRRRSGGRARPARSSPTEADLLARAASRRSLARGAGHGRAPGVAPQGRSSRRTSPSRRSRSTASSRSSTPGLARVASQAPWSGFPRLRVEKVSRASATQRAGRAGRTRPGRCLRLYTRADFESRPEHDAPEIRRLDLAQTGSSWRRRAPRTFRGSRRRPRRTRARPRSYSRRLGALDARRPDRDRARDAPLRRASARGARRRRGRATRRRRAMRASRPRSWPRATSARRAARSSASEGEGHGDGASDLVALLDLVPRSGGLPVLGRARCAPLGSTRAPRTRSRARRRSSSARRAEAARDEEATRRARRTENGPRDSRSSAGTPIASPGACGPEGAALALAGGGSAELAETSVVRDAEWIVALDAEERHARARGGVHRRAPRERDRARVAPRSVPGRHRRACEVRWDAHAERVEAREEMIWGGLVLHASEGADAPEQEARASSPKRRSPPALGPSRRAKRWIGGWRAPASRLRSERRWSRPTTRPCARARRAVRRHAGASPSSGTRACSMRSGPDRAPRRRRSPRARAGTLAMGRRRGRLRGRQAAGDRVAPAGLLRDDRRTAQWAAAACRSSWSSSRPTGGPCR